MSICTKVCPVDAPYGEQKKKHEINKDKCIGCGICTAKCPVQAIDGHLMPGSVRCRRSQKQKKTEAA